MTAPGPGKESLWGFPGGLRYRDREGFRKKLFRLDLSPGYPGRDDTKSQERKHRMQLSFNFQSTMARVEMHIAKTQNMKIVGLIGLSVDKVEQPIRRRVDFLARGHFHETSRR